MKKYKILLFALIVPFITYIAACDSDNNGFAQDGPAPVPPGAMSPACPCFSEMSLVMEFQSVGSPALSCTVLPSLLDFTISSANEQFAIGVRCENGAFGTESCLCTSGMDMGTTSLTAEEYVSCAEEMEKFAESNSAGLESCSLPSN